MAYSILFRSEQSGYITAEQSGSDSFKQAAESIASNHADAEEIGSSDWTYIIKEFLEETGYETYFNERGILCVKK